MKESWRRAHWTPPAIRGTPRSPQPLLGHEEAEARQLTVWAVAQCRNPGNSWEALAARWEVEEAVPVELRATMGQGAYAA